MIFVSALKFCDGVVVLIKVVTIEIRAYLTGAD